VKRRTTHPSRATGLTGVLRAELRAPALFPDIGQALARVLMHVARVEEVQELDRPPV